MGGGGSAPSLFSAKSYFSTGFSINLVPFLKIPGSVPALEVNGYFELLSFKPSAGLDWKPEIHSLLENNNVHRKTAGKGRPSVTWFSPIP